MHEHVGFGEHRRQEAPETAHRVHARPARLSREEVSMPEVPERRRQERRRRRSVAVRDPGEDVVSEQKVSYNFFGDGGRLC